MRSMLLASLATVMTLACAMPAEAQFFKRFRPFQNFRNSQSQPLATQSFDAPAIETEFSDGCPGGVCIVPQVTVTESVVQAPAPTVVYQSTPIFQSAPVVTALPVAVRVETSAVPVETSFAPSVSRELVEEERSTSFRRTMVKAIQKAAADGKIKRREAFRLRVALFSPAFQSACEDVCVAQIAFSGEASEAVPTSADGKIDRDGIDWEGLAGFLERIVPVILQLISLFGQ